MAGGPHLALREATCGRRLPRGTRRNSQLRRASWRLHHLRARDIPPGGQTDEFSRWKTQVEPLELTVSMDDESYDNLTSLCVGHFLEVVQPRLDEWADACAERWEDQLKGEEKSEDDGHGWQHWQHEDYSSFRELFEEEMDVILREQDCGRDRFVSILAKAHREGAQGLETMGSLLIEAMSCIDDFGAFCSFMNGIVEARAEEGTSTGRGRGERRGRSSLSRRGSGGSEESAESERDIRRPYK